jgi:hypothetical protein
MSHLCEWWLKNEVETTTTGQNSQHAGRKVQLFPTVCSNGHRVLGNLLPMAPRTLKTMLEYSKVHPSDDRDPWQQGYNIIHVYLSISVRRPSFLSVDGIEPEMEEEEEE